MSSLQKKNGMTFNQLVQSICLINEKLSKQAAKAVNASLTIRNWMIGMYVAEFELRGSDRAKYGERLLDADAARRLYKTMGEKFIERHGWSYYIITPDEDFEVIFGRSADKRRKLYNGMIKCQLYMYFK